MTRILGRHYDLVSWDAIMTSHARMTEILGRLVSWDAIMTSYHGTPL